MTFEFFFIILLVFFIGGLILSFYVKGRISAQTKATRAKKKYTLLEIRVSKHGENNLKDVEDLFQSLSTFHKKLKFADEIQGKVQDVMTFDILANQGSIRFLISAETGPVVNTIKNYLKARYAHIEIQELPEFPINLSLFPQRSGAYLAFSKPDLLPLKSYKDFESTTSGMLDSLSALTTTLSTLMDGEFFWIQYLVTPVSQKWPKEGEKIMELQEKNAFKWAGKHQKKLILMSLHMPLPLKVLTFPFRIIRWGIQMGTGSTPAKVDPASEKMTFIKQKLSKSLLETQTKILYATKKEIVPRTNLLTEVLQSYTTFGTPLANSLVGKKYDVSSDELLRLFLEKRIEEEKLLHVNTEELALLWHPPTKALTSPYIHFIENALEATEDKGENRQQSQEELAPENAKDLARDMQEKPLIEQPMLIRGATCLGVVDNFSKTSPFIIHDEDRRRHVYIIGQTGTGKSTLQEQMILSTIYKGQGCAVIDPHGELVETILKYIPKYRKNDVAVFDPSDTENPPAFNILDVEKKGQELLATELVGIFHRMFENSWGPRMEQILYNSLLGIIEAPSATLTDLPAFITTKAFREECLRTCTDKNVVYFWHDQFDVLDPKMQKESVVAVLNKVEKFLNNKIVRGVFGSKRNRFNFDFIMNKQKILLVNLSKGKLSPQNSEIIGSMIVSRLLIDAMKRVEIPEAERKDFFLYIDEFQNFVSSSRTFESILSEARKYRLNLNIAHQYIAQMPDELKSAIFGNVGTIISHRIGLEDAPTLVKQFGENDMSEEMLTTLAPYTFYSRSVRNNKITGVLKVKALRPVNERFPKLSSEELVQITEFSKKQYCWNDLDRKTWEEKEKKIEDAKKLQKEMENRKNDKKSQGPVMGPSKGPALSGAKPMSSSGPHTAGTSAPTPNTPPHERKESTPSRFTLKDKTVKPVRDPFIQTSGNVIKPTNLYKPGPKK